MAGISEARRQHYNIGFIYLNLRWFIHTISSTTHLSCFAFLCINDLFESHLVSARLPKIKILNNYTTSETDCLLQSSMQPTTRFSASYNVFAQLAGVIHEIKELY